MNYMSVYCLVLSAVPFLFACGNSPPLPFYKKGLVCSENAKSQQICDEINKCRNSNPDSCVEYLLEKYIDREKGRAKDEEMLYHTMTDACDVSSNGKACYTVSVYFKIERPDPEMRCKYLWRSCANGLTVGCSDYAVTLSHDECREINFNGYDILYEYLCKVKEDHNSCYNYSLGYHRGKISLIEAIKYAQKACRKDEEDSSSCAYLCYLHSKNQDQENTAKCLSEHACQIKDCDSLYQKDSAKYLYLASREIKDKINMDKYHDQLKCDAGFLQAVKKKYDIKQY